MSAPILRLRLAHYCGDFTESLTCGAIDGKNEEEKILQDAVSSLQSVPIVWYRKVKEKKESKTTNASNASFSPITPPPEQKSRKQLKILKAAQTRSPTSTIQQDMNNIELAEDDSDESYYASIEAVMSICDTEKGPALEIKSSGVQCSIFQNKYDILDHNPEIDVISSLFTEGASILSRQDIIERTIPLSMIHHASPGQYWDWQNMINFSSGYCDCAVKLYSGKFELLLASMSSQYD
jgi:hypothetical protein